MPDGGEAPQTFLPRGNFRDERRSVGRFRRAPPGPQTVEQQRRLFNPTDRPLQQPYAAFSAGEFFTIAIVNLVARYLGGRLKISPGFKYAMSNQFYQVNAGHVGANVTAPLPHLSISYQITPHDQVYVNAEGDYRQPSPGDTGNTVFGNKLPQNQYSISEQLGYRHAGSTLIVDVSAFNDNIVHRLLSRYIGSNLYSIIQAGSQTMRGIDASFA